LDDGIAHTFASTAVRGNSIRAATGQRGRRPPNPPAFCPDAGFNLAEAYDKVREYKQQNPGVTKEDLIKKVADNRATIRQRLVGFLSPEQLTKWDAEATKAKEFLGQKLAA
jgi:hypothetical protein